MLTHRGASPRLPMYANDDKKPPPRVAASSRPVRAAVIAALVICAALWALPLKHASHGDSSHAALLAAGGRAFTRAELRAAVARCRTLRQRPEPPAEMRTHNPRDASRGVPLLLRNATVWDGLGGVLPAHDVELRNGLVHRIGTSLDIPEDAQVIDAHGRVVTPGIVDMHSHAGVDPYPSLVGSDDTNESGYDAAVPQMRSIDGFNPHDPALQLALSGGVTSILVLPGSGNLMGGEAFAFKTPKPATNSAEDMLVHAGDDEDNTKKWRWAKHACGENPKRLYAKLHTAPSTRMGNVYVTRHKYQEGQRLVNRQDAWCTVAEDLVGNPHSDEPKDLKKKKKKDKKKKKKPKKGKHGHGDKPKEDDTIVHPFGAFPDDIALEQVTAILRGQIKLNWHCYTTYDIEAQLRIAREFNLSIAAFHHALDLHKIPSALHKWVEEGREPIGAAIFADHWGYKDEAYGASVYAPQVLLKNGIPLAFKSDHPVLPSQWLVFESAKAVQYGLNPQELIKALTSTPARLLGLDYRLGALRPGLDADVVVWNAPPSSAVGARPDLVIVDGAVAFKLSEQAKQAAAEPPDASTLPAKPKPVPRVHPLPIDVDPRNVSLLISNIGALLPGTTDKLLTDVQVRIDAGRVTCVASHCEAPSSHQGYTHRIDLRGGAITPPLVAGATTLVIDEIGEEDSTRGSRGASGGIVYARDWLTAAGGKLARSAASQGVMLTIAVPSLKPGVVAVSALVSTNATTPRVVQPTVAVHVLPRDIREFLVGNSTLASDVLRGRLPLAVHADSAPELAGVLGIKAELNADGQQRWILVGGAEVHLVIDDLQQATNVSVLLQPARCVPSNWQQRRCLTPPLVYRGAVHAAALLRDAGVPWALAPPSTERSSVRNLRFDAGVVKSLVRGLSVHDAVRAVSTDVLALFGIPVARGDPALPNSALEIGGSAAFLAWSDTDVTQLTTRLVFAVDAARPYSDDFDAAAPARSTAQGDAPGVVFFPHHF